MATNISIATADYGALVTGAGFPAPAGASTVLATLQAADATILTPGIVSMVFSVERSDDGGATFHPHAGSTWNSGPENADPITGTAQAPYVQPGVNYPSPPTAQTQFRFLVTPPGITVNFGGTITYLDANGNPL